MNQFVCDKIICVGKNYLDHAQELGDAVPEKPVLFLKPPSVILQAKGWNQTLEAKLPGSLHGEIHHEVEIVARLRVDSSSQKISVSALTIGLDMTARTLQVECKKKGHPWTTAKVFQHSAILGPWVEVVTDQDLQDRWAMEFGLEIGSKTRQRGQGRDMRFGLNELIQLIDGYFPIVNGDILFTGTPAGVGPVQSNDRARVYWGKNELHVQWSH